ncbi:MAG: PilZ domain-containing protein [Pseudorhodoplanes sp.]|nr:hypothetical protein [Pseudorhodoplanes sp.]MCL4713090.1 PilZ domain-containing protein [Pseudorhodoplanes sp.]GIK79248.1 MAG: pilus assembly protein PilZ [Alphaproteobacteria bacterium]
MPQTPDFQDEIIAVDEAAPRSLDVRAIVNMGGRYALASKRDMTGNRREFACRAVNVSPMLFTVAGPVSGPLGERVIAHFEDFGKIQGPIVRVMNRGFTFRIMASDDERNRLAAKIDWIDKNKTFEMRDARDHKRIVPANPHSRLLFADGRTLGCFVIDVSSSGVAVSADAVPEIGEVLAVGKVVGRVVRHFAEGFAVQFIEIQDPQMLEQRLVIL